MAIRLVSLARCKAWVNTAHDLDDTKLTFQIEAASRAIMDYLGYSESDIYGSDGDQEFDSDDNPIGINEVDQAATCLLVQHMYDGFEPDEYGRLPRDVTSMLYVRRTEMGFA